VRKSVPFMLAVLLTASLWSAGFGKRSLPQLQRDWSRFPAIVEVETDADVYALSDVHADYDRLVNLLAAVNLISSVTSDPATVDWTGGKSILVITGDIIDKWKDSLKVIALVQTLEQKAAMKGGRVIVTMGNHEAEFLANPNDNKTLEFANELKRAGLKPSKVANCEGDIGLFLCQLPIAVRVNDWFFCHAGNTNGRTIQELSAAIEKGFQKKGFATKELIGDNSILEARLNKKGPNGLPWFYGDDPKRSPKKLLARYVTKLNVKHLVQGHQPGSVKFPDGKMRHKETIFQRYGLLFLIDSGMSRGIAGSQSVGGVLWIVRKQTESATVICADGSKKLLWDSEAQAKIGVWKCTQ
jgi:Calcineurin-like phosphoesterase